MSACSHGMPTPAACVDCMEEGNLPPAPRVTVEDSASFLAAYDGHCVGCNLPIHRGQRIRRREDSVGRITYRHDGCGS